MLRWLTQELSMATSAYLRSVSKFPCEGEDLVRIIDTPIHFNQRISNDYIVTKWWAPNHSPMRFLSPQLSALATHTNTLGIAIASVSPCSNCNLANNPALAKPVIIEFQTVVSFSGMASNAFQASPMHSSFTYISRTEIITMTLASRLSITTQCRKGGTSLRRKLWREAGEWSDRGRDLSWGVQRRERERACW